MKITHIMVSIRRYRTLLFIGVLVLMSLQSCKDNPERHLQLGNWYLQRGLLDESILEFKEVTRILPANLQELTREEYQVLSKAHYNLALVYTKKQWWDYALKEAQICFDLQPTKDNYSLVDLIRQRMAMDLSDSSDS